MDYEKKYKEALERARHALDCDRNGLVKTDKPLIFSMFAELKESEDERIRKILQNIVKGACSKYGIKWIGVETSEEDLLAWLETHIYTEEDLTNAYECADQVQYKIGYDDAKEEFEKQSELVDTGEISDGYHTFNELYRYRMLYNAAFFNLLPKEWVHKSKKHNDGEECFGGGWFIVMANLPTGQISNHYELKDWDLFQIPEKEIADKWDGHTPQEAANRLYKYLLESKTNAVPNSQSEDEKIREEIIENIRQEIELECTLLEEEGKRWIAWLEKQGEQKSADKAVSMFNVGDWVVRKDGARFYNGMRAVQITNIDGYGRCWFGYSKWISTKDIRPWTLKDAKDGDVLVDNKRPFIFKGFLDSSHPNHPVAYCGINTLDSFISGSGSNWWTNNKDDVKPATKEECGLLYREMGKDGYEWNKTTKELKKKSL